jgi:hypothetical protein
MPRKNTVPAGQARKEGKPMAANEKEFSKLIIKDEKGTSYTLEFNSRVVKSMERRGFKIDTDYPLTMIDDLFLGAFQMHHKNISPDRVKEIWKFQNRKDDLLPVLIKLYMKPLEEMMEENNSGDENETPTWETV